MQKLTANGNHRRNDADGRPGQPSESEFLRYLNMGFHLAPTADQDNHLEAFIL